MITHKDFSRLRFCDFTGDTVELRDWEFMGKRWLGEAVGFSEWLRPVHEPDRLGSLALSLADLPSEVTAAVLARLELPLQRGMKRTELVAILGEPVGESQYVPDRLNYEFEVAVGDPYSVSCTVHEAEGLTYIVISPRGEYDAA